MRANIDPEIYLAFFRLLCQSLETRQNSTDVSIFDIESVINILVFCQPIHRKLALLNHHRKVQKKTGLSASQKISQLSPSVFPLSILESAYLDSQMALPFSYKKQFAETQDQIHV